MILGTVSSPRPASRWDSRWVGAVGRSDILKDSSRCSVSPSDCSVAVSISTCLTALDLRSRERVKALLNNRCDAKKMIVTYLRRLNVGVRGKPPPTASPSCTMPQIGICSARNIQRHLLFCLIDGLHFFRSAHCSSIEGYLTRAVLAFSSEHPSSPFLNGPTSSSHSRPH